MRQREVRQRAGWTRLGWRGVMLLGALFFFIPHAAHAATLYPTSPRHWRGYAGHGWVGAAGGNTW